MNDETARKLIKSNAELSDMIGRLITMLGGILAEARYENNTESGIPDTDVDNLNTGAVDGDIYRG